MKRKTIILALVFLLIFPLHIHARETYTVQPGDSLYRISQKYEIAIDKLKSTNNLQTDIIYIGQQLIIPEKDNNSTTYTVQAGDSLYLLAGRFDTIISRIMEVNNLNSTTIYIGQTLTIPANTEERENPGHNNDKKTFGPVRGKIEINNKTKDTENIGGTIKTEMVSSLNLTPPDQQIYDPSEVIIKYNNMVSAQDVDNFEKENNMVQVSFLENDKGKAALYRLPEGADVEDELEKLKQRENIDWAEPNYYYYPTAVPNDTYYNRHQWNYIKMNMEAAWDITKGDESITVAVLDTGIIPNHPDLKDNLLTGADFVGGKKGDSISNYNITDNDPTDETTLIEGGSHGTHVAGIIGAVTNNSRGIAGINWKTNILPVRVLTRNGGTSWDVAEGIHYALDKDADVINLSLGGPNSSYLQREAVREALEQDVIVVGAAGNEGSDKVFYPAAIEGVIAVGAVDKNNKKTSYSNYGPEIDVMAPGGGYGESIYSTWGYYDNGETTASYGGMIGTSMAAPHVSGVAALLAAKGYSNPEEVKSILTKTAINTGERNKNDYFGYGLVDTYAALMGETPPTPQVFAATFDNNTLTPKSKLYEVEENGEYLIENIETESFQIVAWIDVNKNEIIDPGDYLGKSQVISDSEGPQENVNITAHYNSNTKIKINN